MVQDADLLKELEKSSSLNIKAGKAKKREFSLWDDPSVTITGWKFNEWDYGTRKIKLPVDARGLFTKGNAIIVRGYDKFFNVGEKPSTSWSAISDSTVGPYTLSVKENGCIVFISGLENGTLVVTSKHSTGPNAERADASPAHSWVASQWVQKHLQSVKLTKHDLASYLHKHDITLAGEMCDDEFEEHILPYRGDQRGIYLHGINDNTRLFSTRPMSEVIEIAKKFGFLSPEFTQIETVPELQEFLEECARTGSWKGAEIEGFVIRCKNKNHTDFFFKYKFEEPYLMYREWREVTKAFIAKRPVRFKKHKALGLKYLKFIGPIIKNHPEIGADFAKNKGIISLRQKFLDQRRKEGMGNLMDEVSNESVDTKFVFVTVATLGCGKTTVAMALCHLTGWGLIQNDNITSGGPKRFAGNIQKLLDEGVPAVIADKNNHKYVERKQIIEDIGHNGEDQDDSDIKFVCLNFLPAGVTEEIWQATRDRVFDRGDNHQTIKGTEKWKTNMIMKGFVNRFEPVDTERSPDSMFDCVIDLDVIKGSRYNVEHILEVIRTSSMFHKSLSLPAFSEKQIDDAMEYALNYKPEVRKKIRDNPKKKFRFFAIRIDANIASFVEQFFEKNSGVIDSKTWDRLKKKNLIQKEFHVTIVHASDAGNKNEAAKLLKDLEHRAEGAGSPQPVYEGASSFYVQLPNLVTDVRISKLGFNDKILALQVQIVNSKIKSVNAVAHITVGTDGVPASESLNMLLDEKSFIFDWNVESSLVRNQSVCGYLK